MHPDLLSFLDKLSAWAATQTELSGILLVGSHARGDAPPDSDVDLVLLARNPETYLDRIEWAGEFGQYLPSRSLRPAAAASRQRG